MITVNQHQAAVSRPRPSAAEMLARPHQLIAFVFGIGLIRFWPGTLGTLAGFPLFMLLESVPPPIRTIIYVALLVAGTWAVRRTGEDLGDGDNNAIVFDETIAMSLVLEFISGGAFIWSAGFLLFRLFDVWKPWPVHLAHRAGASGFPVILDDLLAAAYAILVIRFATLLFG